MTLQSFDFLSPNVVKRKIAKEHFRKSLVKWVEDTLRPLEENSTYLGFAIGEREDQILDLGTIEKVINSMMPFTLLGTPAHDLGHHIFDALGGAAIISNDPFVGSGYRNDINAAFFGAMFHDCSTGVQHRYIDSEWQLSHAEIAAAIFFFNTQKILPFNLRVLTAYAIAAHAHMLKQTVAKDGSTRKIWNDELFFNNGRPVRLAVWITRWTDRLENGGDPATHLPRHAMASVDGAIVGGFDLHRVDWYSHNDQLKYLFTPEAAIYGFRAVDGGGNLVEKDGLPVFNKVPTMLQHLKGYADSAETSKVSAYNQHDDKSPNMRKLMDWKIAKSREFVDLVTNTKGVPDFEKFVKLMTLKSGKPMNDQGIKAIQMVRDLWNLNSKEDQSHWANGFDMALKSYYQWIGVLADQIGKATDPTIKEFGRIIPKILPKVL